MAMGGYSQRVRDGMLPLSVAGTLPAAFAERQFTDNSAIGFNGQPRPDGVMTEKGAIGQARSLAEGRRPSMRARSWMVRNSSRRTRRRSHQ